MGSAHVILSLCGKLLIQFPLCVLTQHVRIGARGKNVRKGMRYKTTAIAKEVRGMNYSLDELKRYAGNDPLISLYRKIPAAGQTSVELLRRLKTEILYWGVMRMPHMPRRWKSPVWIIRLRLRPDRLPFPFRLRSRLSTCAE